MLLANRKDGCKIDSVRVSIQHVSADHGVCSRADSQSGRLRSSRSVLLQLIHICFRRLGEDRCCQTNPNSLKIKNKKHTMESNVEQICDLLCNNIDGESDDCSLENYSFIGVALFVLSEVIGLSPHTSSSGILHSLLKILKLK